MVGFSQEEFGLEFGQLAAEWGSFDADFPASSWCVQNEPTSAWCTARTRCNEFSKCSPSGGLSLEFPNDDGDSDLFPHERQGLVGWWEASPELEDPLQTVLSDVALKQLQLATLRARKESTQYTPCLTPIGSYTASHDVLYSPRFSADLNSDCCAERDLSCCKPAPRDFKDAAPVSPSAGSGNIMTRWSDMKKFALSLSEQNHYRVEEREPCWAKPVLPSRPVAADTSFGSRIDEISDVRDLERALGGRSKPMRRSASSPQLSHSVMYPELSWKRLACPGGFRRQFIARPNRDNIDCAPLHRA